MTCLPRRPPSGRPTISDAEMMRALLPRLRARARRLTGDPTRAEDLAQDVALRLWRRLGQGAPVTNPPAYAMRMLRRAAFTPRHWSEDAPFDEAGIPGLPGAALAHLALGDVVRAIETLPAPQAKLMRLVLGGITSPAELAAATGLAPGTVMSRLARARATLRRRLGLAAGEPVAALC